MESSTPAEKARPDRRPTRLLRAEYTFGNHVVRALPGTALDDVLDPEYWAHVTDRLRRSPTRGIGDLVRVIADDGSFDVDLTIIEIDHRGQWARVRPRPFTPDQKSARKAPASPGTPDPDGYLIELAGPLGWRIVGPAGDVLETHLPNREAADAKLAEIKADKARAKAA